ncbi:MAG TPA: cytochrome c [Thermodesulfobacteriota bacterium]|nr:cytochrome c [Thermodesulfobacteriota bacterium]
MRNAALAFGVIAFLVMSAPAASAAEGDAKRGEYLSRAGGCAWCHTEQKQGAATFAGGRALKTDFGTFFGPNITSDPKAGIGKWSEADFLRALRGGVRPDGANFFPAFPYPSFTLISDADLKDLYAFLRSLPPSGQTVRTHDLRFPFGFRFPVKFWNALYLTPGPFVPDPKASPAMNRGAYLVRALGHCGECHTPRNFLGAPQNDRFLAGGRGPDGKNVPNLTPAKLKKWDDTDLKNFLTTGTTPDGDVPAESMGEVIRNTTSQLTLDDLSALIAYLRSLPSVPKNLEK